MTETEIHLIEGLKRQSPKAQQELIDHYGREVFAQVVRLVAVTENAEEVYQDVFVKVFSHIGQYDANRSSLRTWIMRIAYNEAISFLRHKSAPTVYFDDYDRGVETLTDAEVDETLKAIEEEQLPYPQIINSQKIATDAYGITGIPEIILFGPDGTIIARSLRGNAIDKKLTEVFNNKK